MGRGLALVMALQFQALALLLAAWYFGDQLNQEYPQSFNWFLVTFLFALVAVVQTFYVGIRKLMLDEKRRENKGTADN